MINYYPEAPEDRLKLGANREDGGARVRFRLGPLSSYRNASGHKSRMEPIPESTHRDTQRAQNRHRRSAVPRKQGLICQDSLESYSERKRQFTDNRAIRR